VKKWKDCGKDGLYVSVNVSTNDFYHLDVYETLCEVVQNNGIDVRDLRVEITETAILSRKEENLTAINKLRAHGFIVEIDDFGSGYSSLNMLKDIRADALKIDKAFIQDMDQSERNQKILQTIIRMADDLDMGIVVEGVEEKKMVDELASYGCDCFQGYYYSKPLSTSDFETRFLKEKMMDRGMER
jgi:FOG: EAL domain